MLKANGIVKVADIDGFQAFVNAVKRAPGVEVDQLRLASTGPLDRADFIAQVSHGAKKTRFVGEVKPSGQPRYAAAAIAQLKSYIARGNGPAEPVFVAPFLSRETRALCEGEGVNYVDLAGNARIAFDGVYIEREAADNPFKERRELRSLFTPKASQVLKALLRTPSRHWRLTELAAAAHVSIGQVSNVKSALLDQNWARVEDEGLMLSEPNGLLDEWRDTYRGAGGSILHYYTTLHGAPLKDAIRTALGDFTAPHAALASFSAADWYAPYTRAGHETLYADQEGLDQLTKTLQLTPATKGGNVVITYVHDEMPMMDAEFRDPGVWCTSPVQTYLDLWGAGERGREGAEFLRHEVLSW